MNKKKATIAIMLLAAILALFSNSAFSAAVSGSVKDSENNPLPGALIVVANAGVKEVNGKPMHSLGAFAQSNGSFQIRNIPKGLIELKANLIGYEEETISVQVDSDRVENANFNLNAIQIKVPATEVTAERSFPDLAILPSNAVVEETFTLKAIAPQNYFSGIIDYSLSVKEIPACNRQFTIASSFEFDKIELDCSANFPGTLTGVLRMDWSFEGKPVSRTIEKQFAVENASKTKAVLKIKVNNPNDFVYGIPLINGIPKQEFTAEEAKKFLNGYVELFEGTEIELDAKNSTIFSGLGKQFATSQDVYWDVVSNATVYATLFDPNNIPSDYMANGRNLSQRLSAVYKIQKKDEYILIKLVDPTTSLVDFAFIRLLVYGREQNQTSNAQAVSISDRKLSELPTQQTNYPITQNVFGDDKAKCQTTSRNQNTGNIAIGNSCVDSKGKFDYECGCLINGVFESNEAKCEKFTHIKDYGCNSSKDFCVEQPIKQCPGTECPNALCNFAPTIQVGAEPKTAFEGKAIRCIGILKDKDASNSEKLFAKLKIRLFQEDSLFKQIDSEIPAKNCRRLSAGNETQCEFVLENGLTSKQSMECEMTAMDGFARLKPNSIKIAVIPLSHSNENCGKLYSQIKNTAFANRQFIEIANQYLRECNDSYLPQVLNLLSYSYQKLKDYNNAMSTADKVITKYPDTMFVFDAYYLKAGSILGKLGIESYDDFKKAVGDERKNKLAEPIYFFEQSARGNEDSQTFSFSTKYSSLFSLLRYYSLTKNYPETIRIGEEALKVDKRNWNDIGIFEIYLNLAEAYAETNNIPKALSLLNFVISNSNIDYFSKKTAEARIKELSLKEDSIIGLELRQINSLFLRPYTQYIHFYFTAIPKEKTSSLQGKLIIKFFEKTKGIQFKNIRQELVNDSSLAVRLPVKVFNPKIGMDESKGYTEQETIIPSNFDRKKAYVLSISIAKPNNETELLFEREFRFLSTEAENEWIIANPSGMENPNAKFNVFFIGLNYDKTPIFAADVANTVKALLLAEPFSSNQSAFNFYFNAFAAGSIETANGMFDSIKNKKNVFKIVFENKFGLRSHASFQRTGIFISSTDPNEIPGIFIHEFGHEFGKLADEYEDTGLTGYDTDYYFPNCPKNEEAARAWLGIMGITKSIPVFLGCNYSKNAYRFYENTIMRDSRRWILSENPTRPYGEVNEWCLKKIIDTEKENCSLMEKPIEITVSSSRDKENNLTFTATIQNSLFQAQNAVKKIQAILFEYEGRNKKSETEVSDKIIKNGDRISYTLKASPSNEYYFRIIVTDIFGYSYLKDSGFV